MARQRSITIYAENQSDYEDMLSNMELIPSRKRKPCYQDSSLSDTDDEDEGLSSNSNYTLQRKAVPIEEKEKEEEFKLIEKISRLNTQYKEGKELEENDDEEYIQSPHKRRQRNISFIEQNVSIYDEMVKLLVIGEKNVGKSTLIKRITEEENDEVTPTTSFEIKKCIKSINDRKVKIELWDTNENIINSPLIQTYFRIADGFIIIIDSNTKYEYIHKQMELIHNVTYSNAKFYLLNNAKEKDKTNEKVIERLKEDFEFEYDICNLNEFSFDKNNRVSLFIRNVLNRKKK